MGSNDEHVKAMRWLYEDESSYRKAATKLKLDELKAQKEKQLIRQYRRRQRRIWLSKINATIRPISLKSQKMATRRRLTYGTASLVVVGALWGGFVVVSHNQSKGQTKTLGASIIVPDFKPIVTKGNNQKLTTTENNHHKIVSYQDTVAGSAVIVSQQKLPDSFKGDASAITKLDQFKTAEPLDTPKGKLYITTNTTGQQWTAMTYQDVLIFFQTNKRIGFDDWYKYIADLKVQ